MAMKKIVVKVTVCSEKKTRKAFKIAVSISGVVSASLVGKDKDHIEVTGEEIDCIELVTLLRKGVGYTELVSVGPVKEKKPAVYPADEMLGPLHLHPYWYYYNNYG